MRHRKTVNALGRTSSHRKAMMSNMATSLIMHKRIRTTLAKARALRTYVEPLITRSKEDTTHNRRMAFSYLKDKNAVTELFREISPKVIDRPGGYTRILKTENRLGDNAQMCIIELVDYNTMYTSEKEQKGAAKRTRRGGRRGSGAGQGAEAAPVAAAAATKVDEALAEEPAVEETEAPVEAETEVTETVAEVDEVPAEENTDSAKEAQDSDNDKKE
jgi:large subunit ribosomal protein L17